MAGDNTPPSRRDSRSLGLPKSGGKLAKTPKSPTTNSCTCNDAPRTPETSATAYMPSHLLGALETMKYIYRDSGYALSTAELIRVIYIGDIFIRRDATNFISFQLSEVRNNFYTPELNSPYTLPLINAMPPSFTDVIKDDGTSSSAISELNSDLFTHSGDDDDASSDSTLNVTTPKSPRKGAG
jgi:hypothetical protein